MTIPFGEYQPSKHPSNQLFTPRLRLWLDERLRYLASQQRIQDARALRGEFLIEDLFTRWQHLQGGFGCTPMDLAGWLSDLKTFMKSLRTSLLLYIYHSWRRFICAHWNQEISQRSVLFLEKVSDDLISEELIQAFIEKVKFSALLQDKHKAAADDEAVAVIGSRKRFSAQARQCFTDADVGASRSRLRRWGVSIPIHHSWHWLQEIIRRWSIRTSTPPQARDVFEKGQQWSRK